MNLLEDVISLFPLSNFHLKSRMHRLHHFPTENLYVKRDDELSFGISGSKLRKYASLIPFLKKQNYRQIILTGNIYSNHVLGFSQIAIEHQLPFITYLKGDPEQLKGNAFYTRLLLSSKEIHWVSKKADPYLEALEKYGSDDTVFILPEGGSCFPSLPGALTLALDVLENAHKQALSFNDFFIEAGTGLSTIGLILGLSLAKHQGIVHVLLLADNEEIFWRKLQHYQETLENEISQPIFITPKIVLDRPKTAKSFGSVNQTILHEIKQMAGEEGILCDPIYSGKLFHHVRHKILSLPKDGHKLVIHSGGALSLSGFQS